MKATIVALCTVLLLCTIAVAQPPPPSLHSSGADVPFYWIVQARAPGLQLPVPLQLRLVALVSNAWFEVWAPYTPNAVGRFLGDQGLRRPAVEHTLYNKNVAVAVASRRCLSDAFPHLAGQFTASLAALGIDPSDESRDPSNPIGMGNLCADAVLEFFHHDGMNQLGDLDGIEYHRVNWSDYTNYAPINTFDRLIDPDRWQPLMENDGRGKFNSQLFVTPQAAQLRSFGMDTSDIEVDEPKGQWAIDKREYRRRSRDVIVASRELTERQKMIAEYFDNKFASIGEITAAYAAKVGFTLDNWIKLEFLVNNAGYDMLAAMWRLKREYDVIRPVSSIRFLKQGVNIRAWGGPGKGTVTMRGEEFKSYLRTDCHPEYPSGTTCLCISVAESLRKYAGESIPFSKTFVAGSSLVEPGFTPSQNLTVNFNTLTEFTENCSNSRLWGGVHYKMAIEAAERVCPQIGAAVYHRYDKLMSGHFSEEPTTPIVL